MKRACNNNAAKWLQKSTIKMLDDGRLFTKNDGKVEIYDKDFCVDTIISLSFKGLSAFACIDAKPSAICNATNVFERTLETNSSCRESLNAQFRLAYSALGAFSLVSVISIY